MAKEPHTCKFDQRIKRKVPLSQYGATMQNPNPQGMAIGFDYILLYKCACGKTQAYDLERQIA